LHDRADRRRESSPNSLRSRADFAARGLSSF
jgi:hypothetical protein